MKYFIAVILFAILSSASVAKGGGHGGHGGHSGSHSSSHSSGHSSFSSHSSYSGTPFHWPSFFLGRATAPSIYSSTPAPTCSEGSTSPRKCKDK